VIQKDYDEEKVPANFTKVFLRALKIILENASPLEKQSIQSLRTALQIHEQIYFYNMVMGFLSTN